MVASQLLAALPQLHSVLKNLNKIENDYITQTSIDFDEKLLKDNQIQEILNNKTIQKSIDENLIQFDTLIETPLVQQLLNTIKADPNQIK